MFAYFFQQGGKSASLFVSYENYLYLIKLDIKKKIITNDQASKTLAQTHWKNVS